MRPASHFRSLADSAPLTTTATPVCSLVVNGAESHFSVGEGNRCVYCPRQRLRWQSVYVQVGLQPVASEGCKRYYAAGQLHYVPHRRMSEHSRGHVHRRPLALRSAPLERRHVGDEAVSNYRTRSLCLPE